jgi:alanine dehydrogenase
MLIGIPKETKVHEYRVSTSPSGVKELVRHGHQVIVQSKAGHSIGFTDEMYHTAGALLVPTIDEVYARAEMVVKVKEPQPSEFSLIREGQVLFCYLHLAAEAELTNLLIKSGCIAIAYETVTLQNGSLPLLTPMSEVAGRVAVQVGAHYLEKAQGGRGVLLGGVPGVAPGKVTILGGGVVGLNAAQIAAGIGADVTILERSIDRIRTLEGRLKGRVRVVYTTRESIEEHVRESDLLIGAVLIPGGAAPKLVDELLVREMRHGSVIVDVAIDQGGCISTSKPTTHENPAFEYEGVIHYGVTNMPSAVAFSASRALENATLPYILALANKGFRTALREDTNFRNGLNIFRGRVVHEAVANALNHAYTPPKTLLGGD